MPRAFAPRETDGPSNPMAAPAAHRPPHRARPDAGFTLVEILVVILIIGLLSAIALPSFLGQRAKAQDAVAKHAVVATARLVEACAADEDGYDGCDRPSRLAPRAGQANATGLPIVVTVGGADPAEGEVAVTEADDDHFVVVGRSRAGERFAYERVGRGLVSRICSPAGANGCPEDGTW